MGVINFHYRWLSVFSFKERKKLLTYIDEGVGLPNLFHKNIENLNTTKLGKTWKHEVKY